ncbi:MAG: phosphate acetyltransferase [Candidatus Cloacimonetes bacterium]|nr:phosphate acetyltransferase [Candidatus Cloacimonadota bacterium]
MINNFEQLLAQVKLLENKNIVIAAAHTDSVLEAAIMAKNENFAESILVGDSTYIGEYLNKAKVSPDHFRIVDTGNDLALAAQTAVKIVRSGEGHLIMKGICDTSTLLKAVLDKEKGLRTGNIMSDVLVFETPEKLVMMGDGGFIPLPDINEKISILKNCVKVAHSLGNKTPKAAMLTHTEKVNSRIQSTVDAAKIAEMNREGLIDGCIVDGPLALDNAISAEALRIKGISSPVEGNADILVVPNIEAGNIFGKCLIYYCRYPVAHVVLGARVPILIASRAADAETKLRTIALGIICS